MTNFMAALQYRRAATQQASVVGLVIALLDTLIGDLTRAAEAMDKSDIPTRCDQLIHGFKVLTQLESMLNMNNGGEAAINLHRFYTHVRGQMLAAQFKLDPSILRTQTGIVLEVREAWQQVDSAPVQGLQTAANMMSATPAIMPQMSDVEIRASFSCSG
jgi:flagellar secretion chaperone FliS